MQENALIVLIKTPVATVHKLPDYVYGVSYIYIVTCFAIVATLGIQSWTNGHAG